MLDIKFSPLWQSFNPLAIMARSANRGIDVKIIGGAVAMAALIGAQPAYAQNALPNGLRLSIEDVDSDATACGISNEGLRGAAISVLRYNRIPVVTDFASSNLYIVTTTLHFSTGQCVTNVFLAIRSYESITPKGFNAIVTGSFDACDAGTLISSASYNASTRVYDSIRDLFSQCIGSIASH